MLKEGFTFNQILRKLRAECRNQERNSLLYNTTAQDKEHSQTAQHGARKKHALDLESVEIRVNEASEEDGFGLTFVPPTSLKMDERGLFEGRYRLRQQHRQHEKAVKWFRKKQEDVQVEGSGQWKVTEGGAIYNVCQLECPCDPEARKVAM
ncbi:hypothetical protein COOONC_03649 [Cooperia oncophora]